MSTDTKLSSFLMRGLAADRPATPNVPANTIVLYEATDTGQLSFYGSTWNVIGLSSGGMNGANNLSELTSVPTALTNLGFTANAQSLIAAANYAAMRSLLSLNKFTIGLIIDGGGSNITTGFKDFSARIPFAHTITKATALSIDAAGPATSCSITVDVWADTYANFPPTSGDKISSTHPVTLAAAIKSEDTTLTGWSTSIPADTIYGFNVASVTGAKKVLIQLEATL